MTKHRPSPNKTEGREQQQFEKLLAAMGISEDEPLSRYTLALDLEPIKNDYARAVAVSGRQPDRKQVHRYRTAIKKLLERHAAIGPDFFRHEIEKAGWSRRNPDADDSTLHALMAEHGRERDHEVAVLTAHGLDIDHWLKISGDHYRKRVVRKLVVEPFLRLMAERGITTSRKQRPRKRIFDALFDWIGIQKKFRLTDAGINAIARDLEGSASAPKIKR
ncbi:hypothetical protein [Bradyrhizobium sp. CCBAU 45384]|uniref:hypothetical protein n=1 Tax=Bradyrhizobium sp. CCBAU 45384 TaxID=858428 RepID=UPI002306AF24|nr:hypothetical protein [Bradyrhizobium sp. CCBAU 45384]MDA9411896.1 hypothetical protein [Bradyrhizobium sp. CCBAU 45384]